MSLKGQIIISVDRALDGNHNSAVYKNMLFLDLNKMQWLMKGKMYEMMTMKIFSKSFYFSLFYFIFIIKNIKILYYYYLFIYVFIYLFIYLF